MPSTQRKLRREQRVKLEKKNFAARRAPVLVPHAFFQSPCTFPSRPCPTLDALASLSLQVERTRRQVQDTATTKASQPRHRHQRGVTCKIIDVFCACRQGGKGHHSTQTPPPGKKQHRQPTAQHSTARRRTTGHRRARQTQTAPQNDSRARQHSTTRQHSATAQTQGSRAPQPSQQGTAAHRAEKTGNAQHEGKSATRRRHHHRAKKKTAQATNSTTQHSTTGHRRAKQAPKATQHDSRTQRHSTTR